MPFKILKTKTNESEETIWKIIKKIDVETAWHLAYFLLLACKDLRHYKSKEELCKGQKI